MRKTTNIDPLQYNRKQIGEPNNRKYFGKIAIVSDHSEKGRTGREKKFYTPGKEGSERGNDIENNPEEPGQNGKKRQEEKRGH